MINSRSTLPLVRLGLPSTLQHVRPSEATLVDYPESEGDEGEDDGTTNGRRGSAKRQRYDTLTKHSVSSRYDELLAVAIENDEETGKGADWLTAAYVQLQEEFGEIPVSNLSKWTQIVAVRNKILEEVAMPGKKKKKSNGSGRQRGVNTLIFRLNQVYVGAHTSVGILQYSLGILQYSLGILQYPL